MHPLRRRGSLWKTEEEPPTGGWLVFVVVVRQTDWSLQRDVLR